MRAVALSIPEGLGCGAKDYKEYQVNFEHRVAR